MVSSFSRAGVHHGLGVLQTARAWRTFKVAAALPTGKPAAAAAPCLGGRSTTRAFLLGAKQWQCSACLKGEDASSGSVAQGSKPHLTSACCR